MIKKFVIGLTIITLLSVCVSCGPAEVTPAEIIEPEIPSNYSTYTSEGLFSISYPPEWEPATAIMEELFEYTKELMESEDPEVELEDVQMLFLAGLPTVDGWWPNVNIIIGPRSAGYWTLEEIVESEASYSKEYSMDYHEYSRVKTVIDSNDAMIIDSEEFDHEMGTCRYIQAYIVKGSNIWIVTCASDADNFDNFKYTFDNIVRSLRILK